MQREIWTRKNVRKLGTNIDILLCSNINALAHSLSLLCTVLQIRCILCIKRTVWDFYKIWYDIIHKLQTYFHGGVLVLFYYTNQNNLESGLRSEFEQSIFKMHGMLRNRFWKVDKSDDKMTNPWLFNNGQCLQLHMNLVSVFV